MKTIILFCLLLLVAISEQQGPLQFLCYDCSTEPFDAATCTVIKCKAPANSRCYKHIVKSDSGETTYRGCTSYGGSTSYCANVQSTLTSKEKLNYCSVCDEQLCNSSVKISSSVGFIALFVAARQLFN